MKNRFSKSSPAAYWCSKQIKPWAILRRIVTVKLILISIMGMPAFCQDPVKIEITESYELGNIILALTEYGRTDKWDVQKVDPYYREILEYFEPVKKHPLLDSVNYSRKLWAKFLGFRTDMYAFDFDEKGLLSRKFPFNSFGPVEVDKHINLINDFVQKSAYRKFFANHYSFYKKIVENYEEFYLLNDTKKFLDRVAPVKKSNYHRKYIVAISALVGGQNCHRNIDSMTTVDFPNISSALINGIYNEPIIKRIVENHSIFTEMDHGNVNPVSEKYANLIDRYYDDKKWDSNSGYHGIASFNEYMTWALYDIYLNERFPAWSDSIALQWQFQNCERGFIAQNIFSKKLQDLYKRSRTKKLENLYPELLKWCKSMEKTIRQPLLSGVHPNRYTQIDINRFELHFTEPMKKTSSFHIRLYEFKDSNQTGLDQIIKISNARWSADGKSVTFGFKTAYKQFAMIFNDWGIGMPLMSEPSIFLKPGSYLLLQTKN